ncbi:lipoprotein [Klebsiella pneumoniae]|uniref:Lipoprotein n=1 Tax=Klebsiella pneumoniae TaxID=573 RepID=A0A2X3CSC4_KLEPN|nr:lipoprotein [Klebsiella pneumoniae]
MLLRFRVLPLVFVISLLSGCGLASKAFYSAGDKLFQPGDDAVASMQTYSVAQFLQPFTPQPGEGQQRLSG